MRIDCGTIKWPRIQRHREPRRLRFDNSSHLIEVAEQPQVGGRALLPLEDVGVEHVPLCPGPDVGPVAGTRRHQALGRKDLDRLTHGSATGAVPTLDLGDVDDGAGLKIALSDTSTQALDDLLMQPQAFSPS